MLVGLKAFVTVGARLTGSVAVAVLVPSPFVDVTAPVVLTADPAVLSVTLPVMLQLLPVLMVLAFKLKVLAPTPPPVSPPEQVVVRAVETVMPPGKVSLTVTPVRVTVLAAGLVMVMVIVEVPPTGMPVAPEPKALVIVGGATTVRTALAVPPVPSFVELTVPVVLLLEPAVVAVTFTLTSQVLPGVAIEPPLKLIGEEAELNVPPQVLLGFGVAAIAIPAGKVSLTPIPFIAPLFVAGLVMVKVSVEVPLSGMVVGLKDFVIVGGAVTVNVAVAVVPVPPFAALTVPVVLT